MPNFDPDRKYMQKTNQKRSKTNVLEWSFLDRFSNFLSLMKANFDRIQFWTLVSFIKNFQKKLTKPINDSTCERMVTMMNEKRTIYPQPPSG